MRVCLLVHDLSPSGGVKVILAHARGLCEAGHDVELVVTGGRAGEPPDGLVVRELEQVRGDAYEWAIATWWETAAALYEVSARRRLVFLQSFEQRFYTADDPLERAGAAAVLGLPVDYVAVSPWMREALAQVRPGARCRVVPNGVDKSVFSAARREPADGPLRVLVEGQPTLWFKGVQQALSAVRAMREPATVTLVALDPPAEDEVQADRVVGGLSPAEMADLYARSDVLLKLSRVEGLPLPLLEAAHTGVPAVVTPFGAHADVVEHGRNGLVVGYDDPEGTARALDLLAADRELLGRLSQGALETAARWPDEQESSRAFAATVEELDAEEAPRPDDGLELVLGGMRLAQELERGTTGEVRARLRDSQALVHELSLSRDQTAERLDEVNARLDRIRAMASYRVAMKARAALRRVRK